MGERAPTGSGSERPTVSVPRSASAGERSPYEAERRRAAWLFLAPALVVLAVVAGWPLLRTVWFGFTDASLDDPAGARLVGLRNYLEWVDFGEAGGEFYGLLADPQWWRSVWNTIYFTVVSVSVETVLGTVVALVLHTEFRARGVVRAVVLIPWAIPTIVSAKMWAWMLNDQFGILNDLLLRVGLIAEPIAWTASADTAMLAVVIVDIWKTTPFMALLILAGLQTIPRELHEAARMDGATPVQAFFLVTLPLLKPVIAVAIVFRALDALRIFDLIYVLTPNNAQTRTMSVFAQENLIQFDNFAYGSAASTLIFLLIGLAIVAYLRLTRVELMGQR